LAQFLQQADRTCDKYQAATVNLQVVFTTPAGYKGGRRRQRCAARSRPAFRSTRGPSLTDFQQASAAAARNDTQAAAAALQAGRTSANQAGQALADFGASHCRPPSP
jgi:hypothetical protein